jgi:hypothetical protein
MKEAASKRQLLHVNKERRVYIIKIFCAYKVDFLSSSKQIGVIQLPITSGSVLWKKNQNLQG